MKRIGVLTSGGDAPGMNACIRAVVRAADSCGLETMGINRGYHGLINGDVTRLDRRACANIIHQGGTVLGTARSPEFRTREGRARAIEVIKQWGIEGLVLIGGDGTFRGGSVLASEYPVKIVGVPGTIDNDVYGSDFSIGFDTAVNSALQAIDKIRDTALSLERLFFVEVMGHHTGFIALECGIAGGAEELLIPEVPTSIEELCERLRQGFDSGKRSAIVVVAEAEQPGISFRIADEVRDRLGLDSRVVILGHIQRGGSPTARDRVLASKLGMTAVETLVSGRDACMVGEIRGEIACSPLQDTWEKKKQLHPDLKKLGELFSGRKAFPAMTEGR
ncbi:MAG: 6-phosphofructokinase [Chloroflexi bacterium]|nr:6-phosphofructokinase [Chloroflexota bacterium]